MKKLDRITVDPRLCLGQPTIRGMRITVSVVLKLLAEGKHDADIIEQAIRYAAWTTSDRFDFSTLVSA